MPDVARPDTAVPAEITEFLKVLGVSGGHGVDRPTDPAGEWWVDVTLDGREANVAWRPGLGFGLYATDDCTYGCGPDEVVASPGAAAARLIEIMGLATAVRGPDGPRTGP